MDLSQANAHIAQLGQELGLPPDLSLDEGGVCMLTVGEDQLVVSLGHDAAGALRVLICLDDVMPTGAQLSEIMVANFGGARTEGGTFALTPVTGALVLQRRCHADDLNGGLSAVVAGLVRVARHWRTRLQAPASAVAQAPAAFLGARA
ncbi:type III secretion system chaperone [Bordetella genomosp. 13]|uniref:Type III secretion chaperone CesT n=1 Tax=Bordetella genomosp. 13 TaxID=463040 RepID=A0A1W6Z9A6_9BORD|nr:type III secretion system chaperone [Bordetella genomosp. 13]ARP93919.1 hypothetical protein CAL15_05665 [Bordetella genomosp. 13]